jgi:hypothetical protein
VYFADNPCHSSFSRKILQQTEACKELFALKLVKNYLRSTMSQDCLADLVRLSIESEIARKINFDVITRLALKKARKAPLNAIVKSCSNFAIV